MSELRPVAWVGENKEKDLRMFSTNPLNKEQGYYKVTELYTKEQLQPRVKMTKKEADEFKKLYKSRNHLIPIHFLKFLLDNGDSYPLLHSRYWDGREEQLALLTLWLRFDPKKPEETIYIVPEKKWFVRSKAATKSKIYEWLDEHEDIIPLYTRDRKVPKTAAKFDNKDKAEEWTNPLTEAVLLPVGDE